MNAVKTLSPTSRRTVVPNQGIKNTKLAKLTNNKKQTTDRLLIIMQKTNSQC